MTEQPYEPLPAEDVARLQAKAEAVQPDPNVNQWAIRVAGIINTLEVNPELVTEQPEVALALLKGAFNSQPSELMILTTMMMLGLKQKMEETDQSFEDIIEANDLKDLFKE